MHRTALLHYALYSPNILGYLAFVRVNSEDDYVLLYYYVIKYFINIFENQPHSMINVLVC